MEMDRWDAVETAARIAAGDVSAEEVAAAAIQRAEAWEPRLGAVVTATWEEGLEAARGPLSGRFAGVPSFIKDLDNVAGVPTGMGSRLMEGFVPEHTAPSVAQFLGEGFVSLGKSSAPEFGLTCTTEPLGRPPTRNPWDLGRSPGGSSGGAAALAAAGVVPLAYASDGGGSIRIPAAWCGLVGLKPTRDRLVNLEQAEKMPIHITTYGVLTRTVRDTAAFYAAVDGAGPDTLLPPIGQVEGPGPERLRIGLFTQSPFGLPVDPEVAAATERAGRLLGQLGHEVEAIDCPFPEAALEDFFLYWGLLGQGVSLLTRELSASGERSLDPWTLGLARHFRANLWRVPPALYRLRRFTRAYGDMCRSYDALVSPTMARPAPPLGWLAPDVPFETKMERLRETAAFTPFQNISGAPAISLPLGRSREGLPIGVQIAAPYGRERRLLELAFALEEPGWAAPAPPPQ